MTSADPAILLPTRVKLSKERRDPLESARKGGKISFLPNKATKWLVFNRRVAKQKAGVQDF